MRTISKQGVEQSVRRLLDQHGINSPPIPVERLVRTFDVEFRCESFPNRKIRGFFIQNSPAHKNGVIFVNSSNPQTIQRYTLAHEIGHLLLTRKEVHIDRGWQVNSRGIDAATHDPEEIKADLFAAELLMPRHMLLADTRRKRVDPDDDNALTRLARKYEVSLAAMVLRLKELGLLTHRF